MSYFQSWSQTRAGGRESSEYAFLEREPTEPDQYTVERKLRKSYSQEQFGKYVVPIQSVPQDRLRDAWFNGEKCAEACPWCFEAVRWVLPFLCCALANLSMSFLLHVGTYYYIQVMTRFEIAYEYTSKSGASISLSPGLTANSTSFGSLEDPVENWLGWRRMSLKELDAAALVLPACWFAFILYQRDVQIWTKTLVCHSALALLKGVLACLTIVPDSIGWEACKARLGDKNLNHITQLPDPSKDQVAFISGILKMEIHGYLDHKPVRFCADMLYSGHTFVTCLYGFALIELTRKAFIRREKYQRIVIQLAVSGFFGVEQLYEINRVLLNRFHYTMDIVLAIIMVLLWYTNGPLLLAASRWSKLWKPLQQPQPNKQFIPSWEGGTARKELEAMILKGKDKDDAIPFEFLVKSKASEATQKAAAEKGLMVVDVPRNPEEIESSQIPMGLQMWANRWGLGLFPRHMMARRDGDIWIPPACFPFSLCLTGERQSIIQNACFERYDPHEMHSMRSSLPPDSAWFC